MKPLRSTFTPNRIAVFLGAPLLLGSCTALQPPPAQAVHLYVLDAEQTIAPGPVKRDAVIGVAMPQARPGFDTPQMAYVQHPHELDYYAVHRWADTPAHMLAPLMVQALAYSGAFHAVVQTPGPLPADLRLDSELVRLQQDFATKPSAVRITLRVQLADAHSGRVLAATVLDENEPAPSDDAYGGVIAANRALQRMLDQLAEFCAREAAPR